MAVPSVVCACSFSCMALLLLQITICAECLCTYSQVRSIINPSVNQGQTLSEANVNDKVTLHFLVMAPYPDCPPFKPSWEVGPSLVPAAMVAKDHINRREDILKDYNIELIVDDSGCDITSKGINSIIDHLFYSAKNVVGIIGPGCSEATLVIAPLMSNKRLSLIQIAPTASSPQLTDTTLFPNTFRPIASSFGFISMYLEIIKQKNYQQVGALFEVSSPFYAAVFTQFERAVDKQSIQLTSFGVFNSYVPINELRFKIRTVFVLTSTNFSRKILCLAFKHQMVYPDYQLVFGDKRPVKFLNNISFDLNGTQYSCSQKEMEKAVIGMVFNVFRLNRQDKDFITDAGISYNDFSKEYNITLYDHLDTLGLTTITNTEHHSGYFDATWALALSLNNSIPYLKKRGLSLANYTHRMPQINKVVKEELLKLKFEGMRGKVQFSADSHDSIDVTIIDMYQILKINETYVQGIVGEYDPRKAKPLNFYLNESLLTKSNFDLVYVTPHISLGILVIIAITVLFMVLLASHFAHITWIKHKAVKAASPTLNHFIFFGCYLALAGATTYTTTFVFSISRERNSILSVLCNCLQWITSTVYSFIFGTICAKLWRIHTIFNRNRSKPLMSLTDDKLIPVILLPVAIDVLLNILWSSIDPSTFTIQQGHDLKSSVMCKSDNEIIWGLCLVIPKLALLITVLHLAAATRRVHIKEFKTTKSINILIFSLLMLNVLCLPLFFSLRSVVSQWAVSVSYISVCSLYLGCVVLCIILLLLPPLIPPIKEKLLKVPP